MTVPISHSSGKKPNFDPKPQKSRNDSSYQFNPVENVLGLFIKK